MPPTGPATTVGGLFRDIVRRLQRAALHYGHGTHNARDDAAYLILHTLQLPLDDLDSYRQRIVAPARSGASWRWSSGAFAKRSQSRI